MQFELPFDHSILWFVQDHMITPWLTPLMIYLSWIGNSGAIWIVIGLLLCYKKSTRNIGYTVMIALVLTFFIGDVVLKHVVHRMRPFAMYPDMPLVSLPPSTILQSFPSGHTMSSFASAVAIMLAIPKTYRYLSYLACVIAVAMGFSRLYLFVHWPSDVLAGAILGIIMGWLAHKFVVYSRNRYNICKKQI